MIQPEIVIAGIEDVETIAKLAATTFEETYADHNTPEDMKRYLAMHFSTGTIERELSDPHGCFLLMKMGNNLAGYARMRPQTPDIPLPLENSWEIERFYVVSQWHGKGLAQILLQACIETAQSRGYAALWLGVWEKNQRARRFYEKMRFQDLGDKEFVLGTDVQTDRIMVLPLADNKDQVHSP